MRIIQISGKGRVGKTTLANMIAKESFNKGFIPVIIPFAAAIKKLAEQQGMSKEKNSAEYRKFCQDLGEAKRNEDEDYWVTRTFETIQEYMVKEIDNKKENKEHWEYVIIQDDVRYMNELALGREFVATQIFVHSGDRVLDEAKAEWRNHSSEKLANAVEDKPEEYEELFDVIVLNDTLENLEDDVEEYLSEWLELGYLEIEGFDEASDSNP